MRPHPLSMILIALWFSGLAILSTNLLVLITLTLFCVGMLLASRILTPGRLGRTLSRISPLVIMIMLIQLVAVRGGQELLRLGDFIIYRPGLEHGAALSLRILIILLAAKLLTRLTPMDFDAAFRVFRFPEEIGFMVSYAVHMLPGISSMLQDTSLAIRKRGIEYRKLKPAQKLRLYGILALRLVSELLKGSETRAIALELRGFRNGTRTSRMTIYKMSWIDPLIVVVLAAGAIGLFNLQ